MAADNRQRRQRIRYVIRKTIKGTAQRPRLSVYRSNKQIYAQLIDDIAGHTIVSASSNEDKSTKTATKTDRAKLTGQTIARKAKNAGVESIVFDRSGYLYHGRVKSLAEAAREEGLKF